MGTKKLVPLALGLALLALAILSIRSPEILPAFLKSPGSPSLFGLELRLPPTVAFAVVLILLGWIFVSLGSVDTLDPTSRELRSTPPDATPATSVWGLAAVFVELVLGLAQWMGRVSRLGHFAIGWALVLVWGAIHFWNLDRRQGIPLRWRVTWQDWLFLAVLCTVALGFQLHDVNSWKYSMIGDEYTYYLTARDLSESSWLSWNWFEAFGPDRDHPMMVSILQATFMRIFGISTASWRASCAVLMAIVSPFLFFYVKSHFGNYAARAACVVYGFSALVTCWAKIGKTCAFMLPSVVATLGLYQLSRRGSVFYAFLAGAAAGSAFFLHILAGFASAGVLGILVLLDLRDSEQRATALQQVKVILVVWILAASPILLQTDYFQELFAKNVSGTWITPQTVVVNTIHAAFAFLHFEADNHFLFGDVSDAVSAFLILVGVAQAARRRQGESILLLALCIAVSSSIAKYDYPPPTRLPLLVLPWAILAGAGAGLLLNAIPARLRIVGFGVFAVGIATLNYQIWAREDVRALNENQWVVRFVQSRPNPPGFVYVAPSVWNTDLDGLVYETLHLKGAACHDWECADVIRKELNDPQNQPLLVLLHPEARLPTESKEWLLAARIEVHLIRAGRISEMPKDSKALSKAELQMHFTDTPAPPLNEGLPPPADPGTAGEASKVDNTP